MLGLYEKQAKTPIFDLPKKPDFLDPHFVYLCVAVRPVSVTVVEYRGTVPCTVHKNTAFLPLVLVLGLSPRAARLTFYRLYLRGILPQDGTALLYTDVLRVSTV